MLTVLQERSLDCARDDDYASDDDAQSAIKILRRFYIFMRRTSTPHLRDGIRDEWLVTGDW